jgi:small subunit ribosomal protein S17
MAEEETNNEAEEAVDAPEVPALEAEAVENAEAQADTAETEAEVETEGEVEGEVEAEGDDGAASAPAPARPAPAEVVAPKERRRLKRAAKAPASRGSVSHEDRQVERDEQRAKNANARRVARTKAREAKPPASDQAPEETHAIEHAVGRAKARQGIVVSDKAAKTITVRVDTSRRHRRYKKIVRSSKLLHAHDEHNDAHEGDLVRVVETRPLSATKRWRLTEVLERAK